MFYSDRIVLIVTIACDSFSKTEILDLSVYLVEAMHVISLKKKMIANISERGADRVVG